MLPLVLAGADAWELQELEAQRWAGAAADESRSKLASDVSRQSTDRIWPTFAGRHSR